jgi:hypothetical protein
MRLFGASTVERSAPQSFLMHDRSRQSIEWLGFRLEATWQVR